MPMKVWGTIPTHKTCFVLSTLFPHLMMTIKDQNDLWVLFFGIKISAFCFDNYGTAATLTANENSTSDTQVGQLQ